MKKIFPCKDQDLQAVGVERQFKLHNQSFINNKNFKNSTKIGFRNLRIFYLEAYLLRN